MPSRRPRSTVVTTASRSRAEDIGLRERRYIRTQLLRVLCIGLAVLLPVPLGVKLSCFVAALLLPWFGVVMANAGPVASRRRATGVVEPGALTADTAVVIDAE